MRSNLLNGVVRNVIEELLTSNRIALRTPRSKQHVGRPRSIHRLAAAMASTAPVSASEDKAQAPIERQYFETASDRTMV